MKLFHLFLTLLILTSGCLCCQQPSKTEVTTVPSTVESTAESYDTNLESTTVSTTLISITINNPVNYSNVHDISDSETPYYCTYSSKTTYMELWFMNHTYHAILSNHKPPYTHIMCDGTWVYIWTEGARSGVKYAITQSKGLTALDEEGTVSSGEIFTINYDVVKAAMDATNVNCEITQIEDNKFTPSKSMQFYVTGSYIVS